MGCIIYRYLSEIMFLHTATTKSIFTNVVLYYMHYCVKIDRAVKIPNGIN